MKVLQWDESDLIFLLTSFLIALVSGKSGNVYIIGIPEIGRFYRNHVLFCSFVYYRAMRQLEHEYPWPKW